MSQSESISDLRAGAACVDITPPLGTMIPGLFHERFAERIRDPLHARAFVVEGAGQGAAIVVCDLIGVKRPYLDRAKERIGESTGLAPGCILISCTHTHTGAATGEDAYTAFLIERIADVVRLAWDSREPALVGSGQAEEDRVVFNRRFHMRDGSVRTNPGAGNPDVVKPAGPVDPAIDVLCFHNTNEKPLGVLVNYALHYVGVPDSERTVSADYFGAFSRLFQGLRGEPFVAALSNGACGDINNHNVIGGVRPKNDRFQHSERVAGMVAAGAFWAWNEVEFNGETVVGGTMEEIVLDRKGAPSEADLEHVKEIKGKEKTTMAERAFVRRITQRMGDVPDQVSTWVQALRIGDLGIAAVPGELMVELGLDIKARSPFDHTMVIELANDSVGYLPTRKSYDEGGYEPEASLFQPGCGELIADTAVELLEQLFAQG